MKADLHNHTTFSDGKYSVAELIAQANKLKLDYLSITDHDTFVGNRLAYYSNSKTKIIIGIELSTHFKGESVHILGYFKNWEDTVKLESHLETQIKNRKKRAYQIIENLETYHGFKMDSSFLNNLKSITRASLASAMINQKFAKNYTEVFAKYLGDDCPAYIPSSHYATKDGIDLIKSSGGLAVLAHPMELKKNQATDIIALGVMGIEAIYPNHKNVEAQYRQIAEDYHLFITGGSDFHFHNDDQHGNLGDTVLEGKDLAIFLARLYES